MWKVKCTLVQAPRLCTGRTAHRRSRGIALLFLDHGTRRRWGMSVTPRPWYRRLGGPQGRSGQVRKISHPLGFDSRTVQSLYRLRYPAHFFRDTILVFIKRSELTSNLPNNTNFISGIHDRHYCILLWHEEFEMFRECEHVTSTLKVPRSKWRGSLWPVANPSSRTDSLHIRHDLLCLQLQRT